MKKINLIPPEMSVPAKTVVLAKNIARLSVAAGTILFLAIAALLGLLTYYSVQYQKLSDEETKIKNKISLLSQNEQKLFLIKDKMAKIQKIKDGDDLNQEILGFRDFSNNFAGDSELNFSEISLNSKSSEISLIAKTSQSLSRIVSYLKDFKFYKNITVSSLGFNPSTGFVVSLLFN